jgi:hypothetical protein
MAKKVATKQRQVVLKGARLDKAKEDVMRAMAKLMRLAGSSHPRDIEGRLLQPVSVSVDGLNPDPGNPERMG